MSEQILINEPEIDPETGRYPEVEKPKPIGKYKKPETLKDFMTDKGRNDRVRYLKSIVACNDLDPKWQEYLNFLTDNLSGDVMSFSKDHLAYIQKIRSDIDKRKANESLADKTPLSI